jgi:hypothetical protein
VSVRDLPDEPRECGAVIRVHNPDAKYPEIWVASYINGGTWYPSRETCMTGVGVQDFLKAYNGYPSYWDVAKRGRVELLTAGDRGAYREGWRAGTRAAMQACDELEYECPLAPEGRLTPS